MAPRLRALGVSVALGAVLASAASAATSKPPTTRFSLAGGCFTVSTPAGRVAPDAGPLRLQATRLGEYLLYGAQRDFVAADGQGRFVRVPSPAPAAEWRVEGDAAKGFTLANVGTGAPPTPATFTSAAGCAAYPEAELNATGRPAIGAFPTAEVRGTLDTHGHVMTFEIFGGAWHCGRPWHPYGVTFALPDCASLRTGTNGAFADVLETGSPSPVRDTRGWPTFVEWPKHTAVASEGKYYKALERAWLGGLRLMVSLAVDNEALCTVMTTKRRPCDDMESARAQLHALDELENYVDAQAGGPGKGFLRVVTDPFAARRAINRGQLAIVKGVEVSRLFGCGQRNGVPECGRAQVDAGLRELRQLGVTSFFPVHKFDNAFGGTKMDSGNNGVIVGAGNVFATGRFWDVETCPTDELDNDQATTPPSAVVGDLVAGPLRELAPGGAIAPVYPPTPHCNAQDLTELGAYIIERLMDERFLLEVDHLGTRTANSVFRRLEARRYPGLVSSHAIESQLSPQLMPRIFGLGGVIGPAASTEPERFLRLRGLTVEARARVGSKAGLGFGSDMNGLAVQSPPPGEGGQRITYPFRSLDGRVTFERQRWGERVFDLNADGVAQYGMYPDWMEQLVRAAGPAVGEDLMRGAETYLKTWERAQGIAPPACLSSRRRLTSQGLGPLRLGATSRSLLSAAGQPTGRPGRSYRYCVTGSPRRTARVVLDARGRAVLVARTGPAARPRGARGARDGLHIGPRLRRGVRIVSRLRGGRVRWRAAVAASSARTPERLRATVRAAGLRSS